MSIRIILLCRDIILSVVLPISCCVRDNCPSSIISINIHGQLAPNVTSEWMLLWFTQYNRQTDAAPHIYLNTFLRTILMLTVSLMLSGNRHNVPTSRLLAHSCWYSSLSRILGHVLIWAWATTLLRMLKYYDVMMTKPSNHDLMIHCADIHYIDTLC